MIRLFAFGKYVQIKDLIWKHWQEYNNVFINCLCDITVNYSSVSMIANSLDHFFEITTNVVSIVLILSNYASWAVNEFFSSKSKAHCCVVIKALALEDNDVWLLFLDYKIALRLIIVPRRFYSSLKGDCCIRLFEEFWSLQKTSLLICTLLMVSDKAESGQKRRFDAT